MKPEKPNLNYLLALAISLCIIPSLLMIGMVTARQSIAETTTAYKGDVWVDNWFKLYLNGEELIEDSVSITTERSFNKESFTFEAKKPFVLAFEFKDFMENATGLEYIGSRRQQMGDGGAIAQIYNASNSTLVATTNADMKCFVVQKAPLNKSCAQESDPRVGQAPCTQEINDVDANWRALDFDDSDWANAIEYSERAVSPKHGYDQVSWAPSAKLIWGSDLEQDNILYCRLKVE